MSGRYEVFADERPVGEYSSLALACGAARVIAVARPGVDCVVEREGVAVANYILRAGRLESWVA